MAEKTFKNGEVIFREGTHEYCMYELLAGTVGIYVGYGQKNERLLTKVEAENGACFGEMGLMELMPRSATAVALEEVKVEVVTEETFVAYFQERPEQIYAIMSQMGRRIRELSRDYLEVCRAAAEVVETKESGKEKSGWFREHLSKFLSALDSGDDSFTAYDNYWQ